jgi:hypothetical protein
MVLVGKDRQPLSRLGDRAQLGESIVATEIAICIPRQFAQQRAMLDFACPARIGYKTAKPMPQPD